MSSNDKYPRLLLLSDASWSDTNNIGNTFSNLFSGWPKDKIAMIYARPDLPNTKICDIFFQISENRLIKNLFNKDIKPGKKVFTELLKLKNDESLSLQSEEILGKKIYSFFTKYRFNIFLMAREILWKLGNWKTNELDNFITTYNPDIILSLACSSVYMNNLQQYVIKKSRKKARIYFVDDVYSAKRLSFSPFFWLNKLLIRRSLRKTVSLCELAYTIVSKQKKEYDKYFCIESKILTKGGTFEASLKPESILNSPFRLVYTGNIYAGRWETLAKIGSALDTINKNKQKALLYIYTRNQLYSNIEKTFSSIKSIHFMGGIPASEVNDVQRSADILVHVESLKTKEKLTTRLSFSTKLVDYFEQGKCIFAVGWNEAASIDYLMKNEAAVVVDNLNKLEISLERLINNPELIKIYGNRAWECGRKNHQIQNIKEMLLKDMNNYIN